MGFSRQEYWSGLPFPSPIEMKEIHYTLRTERNDQAPYFNGALIMCVEGGGSLAPLRKKQLNELDQG